MGVKSDSDLNGGQPHLQGHVLSVGTAVVLIKEKGLMGFIKEYGRKQDIDNEVRGIRQALDYCRNQRCVVEALRYCAKCSKSGNPEAKRDLSAVAEELYMENFVKSPYGMQV